jgi:sulfite oxidase
MLAKEFPKSPHFLVRQDDPYNGEPPLKELVENRLTPIPLFFARNHGDIPDIDAASYRLEISGLVERPLALSLADLLEGFPAHSLTATLQCAGNRRLEMTDVAPISGELPWDNGAVSTAEWRGVRLSDVLKAARPQADAQHVDFTGLDQVSRLGRRFGFGGSIPLEKALGQEVLLAFEMNGQPLTPLHGYPLRAVVPGYIGARSVKWLSTIQVRSSPSQNYFYARAYQLFPPQADAETVDWDSGIKLGDFSVNAVICAPQEGARIAGQSVRVQGYAVAGGGRAIARVDLSIDGGHTWVAARLDEPTNPWTWRLWQAELELAAGPNEIVARAWDSAANTQPEDIRQTWNFKGYLNNSWHRVRVHAGVP